MREKLRLGISPFIKPGPNTDPSALSIGSRSRKLSEKSGGPPSLGKGPWRKRNPILQSWAWGFTPSYSNGNPWSN
ncbi:hypothetical protein DSO57_1029236 [Entomophthora muscae]|uniref:Uncharacterized protein n=1 Tax=Entomophthora muscae TaxID=34485 RepID=A0ACC2RFX2_9FUNG|nr:hypothetical protein DSO57_1029236 [Entomophthora muscae]